MPDHMYQHERCECHECTQARWKLSFQYQIESALHPQQGILGVYDPAYPKVQGTEQS